jgi:hypothetical protein
MILKEKSNQSLLFLKRLSNQWNEAFPILFHLSHVQFLNQLNEYNYEKTINAFNDLRNCRWPELL